jgi:HlyD family secretion protein
MKRRAVWGVVVLLVAGGVSGAYLYAQSGGAQPRFRTAAVTRGDLTAAVSATGNLNAVVTVLVGSQVSGQIKELYADFNSQVKRGQLIARIDPETFEAKVTQARAEVEAAEASVLNQRAQVERARAEVDNARAAAGQARAQTAKARVALADARRDLERKRDLFRKDLIARSDLDSAQALHDSAEAQVEANLAQEEATASAIRSAEATLRVAEAQLRSAEASVRQKRAALQQAEVDLDHTKIRAPVDGVVISRAVDVGQTVAASLQAPTLFTIAQDLTKMQIDTNVDEADIGRIQVGQRATFTVDAFPRDRFQGQVIQIRKASKTIQNVVTYIVVVAFDNPEQKLVPGMTANVRVVTEVRSGVLQVSNAALRFRPPGEEAPPPADDPRAPFRRPAQPTLDEIRARLVKELALTPEQQKQVDPILEESRSQFVALQRVPPEQRRTAALRAREEARQKIRALLAPEQQVRYDQMQPARAQGEGTPGRLWVLGEDGRPRAVTVRLGISDGTNTEILGGDLKDGQEVLIGTIGAATAGRSGTGAGGALRPRF